MKLLFVQFLISRLVKPFRYMHIFRGWLENILLLHDHFIDVASVDPGCHHEDSLLVPDLALVSLLIAISCIEAPSIAIVNGRYCLVLLFLVFQ